MWCAIRSWGGSWRLTRGRGLDPNYVKSSNPPPTISTGLLLFARGGFLQALEGEHDQVAEVFARISNDQRHHGIEIITDCEVTTRQFGNWAMASSDGTEGKFGGKGNDLIVDVACPMLRTKFNNFADYV